jgi:hypothetical protein
LFAVVLQQEKKKLAAKSPKKAQTPKLVIFDESSDSPNCNMSIDNIPVNKMDMVDIPS